MSRSSFSNDNRLVSNINIRILILYSNISITNEYSNNQIFVSALILLIFSQFESQLFIPGDQTVLLLTVAPNQPHPLDNSTHNNNMMNSPPLLLWLA